MARFWVFASSDNKQRFWINNYYILNYLILTNNALTYSTWIMKHDLLLITGVLNANLLGSHFIALISPSSWHLSSMGVKNIWAESKSKLNTIEFQLKLMSYSINQVVEILKSFVKNMTVFLWTKYKTRIILVNTLRNRLGFLFDINRDLLQ